MTSNSKIDYRSRENQIKSVSTAYKRTGPTTGAASAGGARSARAALAGAVVESCLTKLVATPDSFPT